MAQIDDTVALPAHHKATKNEKFVVGASSLGTVFEWYDFYLLSLIHISQGIVR